MGGGNTVQYPRLGGVGLRLLFPWCGPGGAAFSFTPKGPKRVLGAYLCSQGKPVILTISTFLSLQTWGEVHPERLVLKPEVQQTSNLPNWRTSGFNLPANFGMRRYFRELVSHYHEVQVRMETHGYDNG